MFIIIEIQLFCVNCDGRKAFLVTSGLLYTQCLAIFSIKCESRGPDLHSDSEQFVTIKMAWKCSAFQLMY